MLRRPLTFLFVFAASISTPATLAHAETPITPVVVQYTRGAGTESCPDEDELRRAVAGRLGYDPFAPNASRQVLVHISRRPRELVGRMEVRDADGAVTGTRELVSPSRDCRELVASLSVAIAIGIDPVHGLSGNGAPQDEPDTLAPVPPHVSEPTPPPVPTVPPALVVPSAPEQPTDPLLLRGSVGAIVAIGAAPTVAAGITISIGARKGRGSLQLEGRADLPTSTTVSRRANEMWRRHPSWMRRSSG